MSTASLLQLQRHSRGPEGPLCWVLAFSTASCSLIQANIGENTKEDYEQYSLNLKEKRYSYELNGIDKIFSLYHFLTITRGNLNIKHLENRTLHSFKARHDWVGKVIHWESGKKFKFDHTNKWYMLNPAPVLENDTHKLLWDFNIRTDHLIPARSPDLIIINKQKKIFKIIDFAVPVDHRINLNECEKKGKYLDLARVLKKLWNM